MIASYEIEFIGLEEAAEVLATALKIAGVGFVVENGSGTRRLKIGGGRKVVVRRDCIEVDGKKMRTFADVIARRTCSDARYAVLGAIAWLGIVGIEYILAASYGRGYLHAVAARRCYEMLKARSQ